MRDPCPRRHVATGASYRRVEPLWFEVIASRQGRLTPCVAMRAEACRQIAGSRHVPHPAYAVPARGDEFSATGRCLVPGPALRAHPLDVRLPIASLVRLVRGQRPGPTGRDPTRA